MDSTLSQELLGLAPTPTEEVAARDRRLVAR